MHVDVLDERYVPTWLAVISVGGWRMNTLGVVLVLSAYSCSFLALYRVQFERAELFLARKS